MILGIGSDIIEISRIKDAIEKNEDFIKRVFSESEIRYFESRKMKEETIAGNFAAKEAVVKALGVGFRGFEFQDIEILRDSLGKPYVNLYNNAKNIVSPNCMIHITISHCKEYATSTAVLEDWEGHFNEVAALQLREKIES